MFQAFRISGLVTAEIIRTLSDSLILPFSVTHYANVMIKGFKKFESEYKDIMENELNITLDYFESSIYNLSSAAEAFHKRLSAVDKSKYHLVRMFNDQLRSFEGAFLDPFGNERDGYQWVGFIHFYASNVNLNDLFKFI